MHTLKRAVISAAYLGAHACLFGAWKAGSAGAGNLLIGLLAVHLAASVLVLVFGADALPAEPPPEGLRKAWRSLIRWGWIALAGAMVWHGHFVLGGMVLVASAFGAATQHHAERKHKEAAHG